MEFTINPQIKDNKHSRSAKKRRYWLLFLCSIQLLAVFLVLMYMTSMPGRSFPGPKLPLSGNESLIRDNIITHVQELSSRIGERNMRKYSALNEAAGYIRSYLQGIGLITEDHDYTIGTRKVCNIQSVYQGSVNPTEIVVVGAHYDSVNGSPGANDNATGVAAVLELARLLRDQKLDRTVRLVTFVNEEPPYFQTTEMGSLVYARRSRQSEENIVAMISIESIGNYSDMRGSQKYPFPLILFYPDTANFIGFVGNTASRSLVREAVKHFREAASFPSEGIAAPEWMTGISWSDHWSFWQQGYPAIMITDTALFRDNSYHTASDTADRIDYEQMARIVAGIERLIIGIANRK